MIYRRTERFRIAFQKLHRDVQGKVIKAFELFQADQRYPSLMLKKMQGYTNIWEGRIDQQYRFTFEYRTDPSTGETLCIFRNVDNHDECLKNP